MGQVTVIVHAGEVLLVFGAPVVYMGLNPDGARELARVLLRASEELAVPASKEKGN
jgi:hypothetical protein